MITRYWHALTLLTLLLLLSSCKHDLYVVKHLTGELADDNKTTGIIYVLPKTELLVEVDVEQLVYTFGPYGEYARPFGLIGEPIVCPDRGPSIKKSGRVFCTPSVRAARVKAVAVPDLSARYAVTILDESTAVDRALRFKLADDGRMTESEATVDDHQGEIALHAITTALKLAASFMGMPTGASMADAKVTMPSHHPCGSGSTQSDPRLKEACQAYKRLIELVSAREDLIAFAAKSTHDANVKHELSTLAMSTLQSEISSLEALFAVSKASTMQTIRRAFIPTADRLDDTLCFEKEVVFPTAKGPEDATCPAGAPQVTIAVKPEQKPSAEKEPTSTDKRKRRRRHTVASSYKSRFERRRYENVDEKCGPQAPGKGLVYRFPMPAWAKVTHKDRALVRERVSIPQLGPTIRLPHCFHNKKTTLVATLSPDTGMLQSISLTGESMDPKAGMTEAGTSAESLVSAIKAGQEAEKTAADAAAALERKEEVDDLSHTLELLKLQAEINCYNETGKPCPEAESDDSE